ncbi:Unknown protein, partial [Striga hermonthica]
DLEYLEGLERELTPWEQEYLEEMHGQKKEYERQLKIMKEFVEEKPLFKSYLSGYVEEEVAECVDEPIEYDEPHALDEGTMGMERQFLSLKQGTRTVDEYEREFTRLAAFVPDLVRTDAQRAQRFIDGLYPAVRHNIVGHWTQTYARAVSIAQEVDASIRRETVRDRSQPSALAQSFIAPPALPAAQPTKEKKKKGKGAQTDRRTRQRQQQVPPCPTCGRLHRGECHMGQDICYYCHEPGHF